MIGKAKRRKSFAEGDKGSEVRGKHISRVKEEFNGKYCKGDERIKKGKEKIC